MSPPFSPASCTGPRAACSASGSKVPAAPQLKPRAAAVSKRQAKGPEVWAGLVLGGWEAASLALAPAQLRSSVCAVHGFPAVPLPLTSAPSASKRSASFLTNSCFPGNPALRLQGRSSHCDAAASVGLEGGCVAAGVTVHCCALVTGLAEQVGTGTATLLSALIPSHPRTRSHRPSRLCACLLPLLPVTGASALPDPPGPTLLRFQNQTWRQQNTKPVGQFL